MVVSPFSLRHPRLEPFTQAPLAAAAATVALPTLPYPLRRGVALLFHARLVPPTPLVPWSSNTPDYGRLRPERFRWNKLPESSRRAVGGTREIDRLEFLAAFCRAFLQIISRRAS